MIEKRDAPQNLSKLATIYVHRDEVVTGQIVRILPELRPTIQIRLADNYWLKDKNETSWHCVPKISFWGPKYSWCYGYAEKHVKVFGIAVTPILMKKLTKIPMADLIDKVFPLEKINSSFAQAIIPDDKLDFNNWVLKVSNVLEQYVSGYSDMDAKLIELPDLFATIDKSGFGDIANDLNQSERHFRRLFKEFYGVSPKLYQRVLRVERIIKQLHDTPWEIDAYADYPIWYSDQPHLIREFRALTGTTPNEYIKAKHLGDATLRSVYLNNALLLNPFGLACIG